MANDFFLKLDGIDGESTDDQFKNWIKLMSWSWGATQTSSTAFGMGGGAGKVTIHNVSMTAALNAVSPSLFNYCTSGKKINWAELNCRKAGDPPQVYMKIKLTEVYVASYQNGGHDDDVTDIFTLNFAKVEMCYGCQGDDGKVNSLDKKAMWDLRTNKSS
jgi:type VI secretion system secreted protein Hcp